MRLSSWTSPRRDGSKQYCPFKTSQRQKPPGRKKIYIFLATPRRKIYLKLRKWSSQVADFRKNCYCGIAELRLRSNISLKVAELRLWKCFLQVAELRLRTKKNLRVPTSGLFTDSDPLIPGIMAAFSKVYTGGNPATRLRGTGHMSTCFGYSSHNCSLF